MVLFGEMNYRIRACGIWQGCTRSADHPNFFFGGGVHSYHAQLEIGIPGGNAFTHWLRHNSAWDSSCGKARPKLLFFGVVTMPHAPLGTPRGTAGTSVISRHVPAR